MDSDSEAFTSIGVGLPNEARDETEPAQGHVRNRIECLSPANRKRPRTCLAESGQMAVGTNQEGKATYSCTSSVVNDDDCDEEDPLPSLVNSTVRKGSDPDQEAVQEEATPDSYLPPG